MLFNCIYLHLKSSAVSFTSFPFLLPVLDNHQPKCFDRVLYPAFLIYLKSYTMWPFIPEFFHLAKCLRLIHTETCTLFILRLNLMLIHNLRICSKLGYLYLLITVCGAGCEQVHLGSWVIDCESVDFVFKTSPQFDCRALGLLSGERLPY